MDEWLTATHADSAEYSLSLSPSKAALRRREGDGIIPSYFVGGSDPL